MTRDGRDSICSVYLDGCTCPACDAERLRGTSPHGSADAARFAYQQLRTVYSYIGHPTYWPK